MPLLASGDFSDSALCWRCVLCQACHHPPISACHCESKNFLFWQGMSCQYCRIYVFGWDRKLVHYVIYCAIECTSIVRLRSHCYEYESGYLHTGSSKHEFACITNGGRSHWHKYCMSTSYQWISLVRAVSWQVVFLSNSYDVNNAKFVLK